MDYVLRVIKKGNLERLSEEIIKENIVDKQVVFSLIFNTDIRPSYNSDVIRLSLLTKTSFNDHFFIRIYNDQTHKYLFKQFTAYNNIKQLIVFKSQKSTKESVVRLFGTAFNAISPIESEFGKPFWRFTEDDVRKAIARFEHDGKKIHTIQSYVSLYTRAQRKLHEIKKSLGISTLNDKNNWDEVKVVKLLDNKKGKTKKNLFITKNVVYNKILKSCQPSVGVIVLLLFKGARLNLNATYPEIAKLKFNNIQGKKLIIDGEKQRTIPLSDEDLKYIDMVKGDYLNNDDYILQPLNHHRHFLNEPLKTWTIKVSRIKMAAENTGIPLSYKVIRESGKMFFIEDVLRNEYKDVEPNDEQWTNIFIRCLIRFGVVSEKEADLSFFEGKKNGVNRDRIYRLKQLWSQYSRLVKK